MGFQNILEPFGTVPKRVPKGVPAEVLGQARPKMVRNIPTCWGSGAAVHCRGPRTVTSRSRLESRPRRPGELLTPGVNFAPRATSSGARPERYNSRGEIPPSSYTHKRLSDLRSSTTEAQLGLEFDVRVRSAESVVQFGFQFDSPSSSSVSNST